MSDALERLGLGGQRVFNADDPADRMALRNRSMLPTYPEVIPRDYDRRPVGSIPGVPAVAAGDEFGAPDMLVSLDDYQDAIDFAHEFQVFPSYAQTASWAPKGFQYNQNGLGYCWTWGGTACLMDLQRIHCVDMVLLAPVSMGYLVNWRNAGNYLESYIGGARDQGVCAAINGIRRSPTPATMSVMPPGLTPPGLLIDSTRASGRPPRRADSPATTA